jgi:hypothetical protein
MTTPNDTDTIVDEPEAPKKWTLPELRKFDGQLFIQNLGPTKITFHERMGDKSVDFELDPASISTDPEMEEQIMLLNAHAVGASEERMREIMGLQTPSNVHGQIEEHLCLVCGRRNPQTSVIERGRVLLSRRQIKDGTPPLCQEHTDQARFFVPRLVSDKGEEHWEFDSLKMNAVQR